MWQQTTMYVGMETIETRGQWRYCVLGRQYLHVGKSRKVLAVVCMDASDPMRLHCRDQETIKNILPRDLRMLLQQSEDPIDDILTRINLANSRGLDVLLHFFPRFLRRARLRDTPGIRDDSKKLKKNLRTHCYGYITLHALITEKLRRRMKFR